MNLNAPITQLKGIGPRRALLLGKLGLFSLRDLLYYVPRDYCDYSSLTEVAKAAQGEDAALCVTILREPKQARVRGNLRICTAPAQDETGKLTLTWYNQPYGGAKLQAGQVLYACGRIDRTHGVKQVNPVLFAALPGMLPVYPLAKGISQTLLRQAAREALRACLQGCGETLPPALLQTYGLLSLQSALQAVHFPQTVEEAAAARRRLAFEDMLLLRVMLRLLHEEHGAAPVRPFRMEGILPAFAARMPFALTGAQLRASQEIAADLNKPQAMNRLLQGDVGSGKTAVALFAMFAAAQNGRQAALMAPTEILARQHYAQLCALFGEQKVCLLQGGMHKAAREQAYEQIRTGAVTAIIGTHALLQAGVEFYDLGLVITDEQHRFGVRQRAAFGAKGKEPGVHTLIMSATPIPRTLSLILYGDLDISVLDELPPGRKPILTRLVPQRKRADMYAFVQAQVQQGRQAYVVCPLVEQSDALENVLSAEDVFAALQHTLHVRLGLLHGQMPQAQKEAVAAAFRAGEIDVLVATTVIEVGVDVPNAAVMVVENAGRFGLAQLHQLRGRVGRSSAASYCFLLPGQGGEGETAMERLRLLTKTQDGFAIAQKDLEMRGPGEFLGKRQHGLSQFAAARLVTDMEVLRQAEEAAEALLCAGAEAQPILAAARARLLALQNEVVPN
ncbi:MAG: ATP-dependent DNA helicase RecG [Christensenellaceae bacterium]|jgi:ATP-dependent DNA helicase RecG|nr:ATP-dependent DNA helicase RecG [Christensenellaceae bacterium]